jgi:4-alpha-glucanotransferase
VSDASLEEFAESAGLAVHWHDVTGRLHKVSLDVLRHVLTSLGYSVGSDQQIAESTGRLAYENRQIPPLLTAWIGDEFRASGQNFRAPDVPGYHPWEINGVATTLAASPRRCISIEDMTDARLAGLGVQLYGLRGGTSGEFGDFAALGEFASRAAAHGIDAIAISPVHALFAADPSHYGPYSPSSRIFLNALYADLRVCGGAVRADDGGGGLIDWQRAAAAKYLALRQAHRAFDPYDSDDFIAFCNESGERLFRHALFETLDAHFRKQGILSWRHWPSACRDPAHPDVLRFAVEQRDTIEFHHFAQFLAARSLENAQSQSRRAGMKIGIVADIATGIDPNGSDCWASPDDVLNALRIGAPPDLFNAAGQNWGVTALSPMQLRKSGYAGFIAMMQANMKHAGGVRVDHAMGLMRLWVIPEGAAATDGVYLRYPLDDLVRLICLESYRARAIVIGEDLGTVPGGFSEMLAQHGIFGMQVLWFEQEKNGDFVPPSRWRREAVAMTSTHDLPTVAGWWTGRDIDWRAKLGIHTSSGDAAAELKERRRTKTKLWSALLAADCVSARCEPANAESVVDGASIFVGKTPSRLAVLPAEDICGLEEQPNFPGTTDEHPNWRRRLPPGELFSQPSVADRIARFVQSRRP